MHKIEMSESERQALLTIVGTLERKAKSPNGTGFWKARMAPLAGLIERVRSSQEAVP